MLLAVHCSMESEALCPGGAQAEVAVSESRRAVGAVTALGETWFVFEAATTMTAINKATIYIIPCSITISFLSIARVHVTAPFP